MKDFPIEILFGVIAIIGGIARYLNNFTNGQGFRWSMLLASSFVSGFSGYMFAVMGTALNFPTPISFIMAGTGGFFGDQTMKLVMDYFTNRVK